MQKIKTKKEILIRARLFLKIAREFLKNLKTKKSIDEKNLKQKNERK